MPEFNRSPQAKERRKKVIDRLEKQLLTGFKPVRNDDGSMGTVPLNVEDKTRIREEIAVLRTRI